MNGMTCGQVAEHLDLLAAGECDRQTRRAVERHLESCATCSARYAESRRLQGLLALHWNEAEQRNRLRQRVEEADRAMRYPRRLVRSWANRVASLAALLLVTLGLALLLPTGNEQQGGGELAMTAVVMGGRDVLELKDNPFIAQAPAAVTRFDVKGLTLSLQEVRGGEPQRPPAIGLGLELENTGIKQLDVRLGGADAELRLDVRGTGVLRRVAPDQESPALLQPQALRLAPGERRWLRIERLIAVSGKRVEYVYLTEPGEYTLTIRLRAVVNRVPVILTSGPIRINIVP
jgi:Putative zinc-finger